MGILSDLKPLTGSSDYTSPNGAIESLVKDNPSVSRFFKRDPFWDDTETVTTTNWSKLFPYQLKVLGDPSGPLTFTLPIPPEAIQISIPFAINTQVTLGGIIEEHNGSPIRTITLRGTTGLLPYRPTAAAKGNNNPLSMMSIASSVVNSIAGGTVSQGLAAARAIKNVASPWVGSQAPNQLTEGEKTEQSDLTGYAQWRYLQRFLERYTNKKKTKQGANLRLALCMWKDEAVYLVTPTQFEVTKDASSPLEYRYTLQFKAWKRINLINDTTELQLGLNDIRQDPTLLARGLETLRKVQQANKTIGGIPQAILADYDRLVREPVRQAALAMKSLLGVGLAFGDLVGSKGKDAQGSDISPLNRVLAPAGVIGRGRSSNTSLPGPSGSATGRTLAQNTSIGRTRGATQVRLRGMDDILQRSRSQETSPNTTKRDIATLRSYQKEIEDQQGSGNTSSHPANNVDLDEVPISAIDLPPDTYRAIQQEVQKTLNYTRDDWEQKYLLLKQGTDLIASQLGLITPTYSSTYQSKLPAQAKTPTTQDFLHLQALEEALKAVRLLALSNKQATDTTTAKFDYYRTQAQTAGIQFPTPKSKFGVPLPYGSTLQSLAQLYLGNPDRWVEIATLNNLQAPYIDEEGFIIPFSSNGSGNSFTVATSTTSNYIRPGDSVFLSSKTSYNKKYTVVSVKSTPTTTTLQVNGNVDLLKTKDDAILHAFLPYTTNSTKLVFIPLDTPVDQNLLNKSIVGVDEYNTMTQKGGVDLKLNINNDLIITPQGDTLFSVGLPNIVQQLKILLSTIKGQLPLHQAYGLPQLGDTTATTDAQEIKQSIYNVISQDPTFSSVEGIQVTINKGTILIYLNVVVSGTDTPIPISYQIKQ